MVIVVKSFAQHQDIDGHEVCRSIALFEISISYFMSKPVDDRTMDRTHQKVKRYEDDKERINPCRQSCKVDNQRKPNQIEKSPSYTTSSAVSKLVKAMPLRKFFDKVSFERNFVMKDRSILLERLMHHANNILGKHG